MSLPYTTVVLSKFWNLSAPEGTVTSRNLSFEPHRDKNPHHSGHEDQQHRERKPEQSRRLSREPKPFECLTEALLEIKTRTHQSRRGGGE